ncbi:MAG: carboxypeptidase regulatory-like domain-containing protein, partial [Acidobacteriaceae bacterium]|nr:carboxypeptidase regulatory-like domain-containing protein [Acidobacteriaceae bacterium]
MFRLRAFASIIALLLLLAAASHTRAADITGSIFGTVTDPSGAPVPGATVHIVNVDRNRTERTLTTAADGNFTAELLPIGHYSIDVEAKGFKKATVSGIVLNVNDKLTYPVVLQVGDVTQSVTVEASPLEVQLQSAEQSTTITGTQVRDLTLNNRNYEQLVTLMPGVSSTASDQIYVGVSNPTGESNQVNFSINGSRPTQNNWTVDGADNLDRGANLTLLNYPSVDALQEFKVLRSDYSAEFGRAGGGQINVVTKSGTSQFHGDAYEFNRNDAYSANSFLNDQSGIKEPPLRYNDFGWTLGGPIFIPHIYNREKNKTFFFVSEEFRRVITYSSFIATMPTTQMEQGIFAHPVCLSYTTTCTQTGTTVTNINPVAAEYIKDIYSRSPTGAPGSFSTVTPIRNIYDFEQELYKIDHVFSPKLQVSVRFLRDQIPTVEPGGLFTASPIPGVSVTNTNSPGRSWVARATSILS